MCFASRRFSSRLGWARGGLGGRSGLRSGRFDAECLLDDSVGHRRARERCVSLRAASLRAWGGRRVASAGKAAFDRAALIFDTECLLGSCVGVKSLNCHEYACHCLMLSLNSKYRSTRATLWRRKIIENRNYALQSNISSQTYLLHKGDNSNTEIHNTQHI